MFTPDNELIADLVSAVENVIDRRFETPLQVLESRVPPADRVAWIDAWGCYVVEVTHHAALVVSLGLVARPIDGDDSGSARQNVKARVIAAAQDIREPLAALACMEALDALYDYAPDVARELAEIGDPWLAAAADYAAEIALTMGALPRN